MYEDNNYTYSLNNPNDTGKLIVQNKSTNQILQINNFNTTTDEYLGIKLDKTPPPRDVTVDISNYSNVSEGDNGIKYMTFTVKSLQTLQSNESITLNLFIDSDSDADSSDYGSLSQNTVTLNSSKQSHEVTLEIKGDTQVEEDVWLNANVSTKTNLENVEVHSGLGVIEDDDSEEQTLKNITVHISDSSVQEGNSGDRNKLVFNISSSKTLQDNESVTLRLDVDNMYVSGSDYVNNLEKKEVAW